MYCSLCTRHWAKSSAPKPPWDPSKSENMSLLWQFGDWAFKTTLASSPCQYNLGLLSQSTGVETEDQRGYMTCPRSQSKWQSLKCSPDLCGTAGLSHLPFHMPLPHARTPLSPCIFPLTLQLCNTARFHLILLPLYRCSLSLCLWVKIESELQSHRTSISIFQTSWFCLRA